MNIGSKLFQFNNVITMNIVRALLNATLLCIVSSGTTGLFSVVFNLFSLTHYFTVKTFSRRVNHIDQIDLSEANFLMPNLIKPALRIDSGPDIEQLGLM